MADDAAEEHLFDRLNREMCEELKANTCPFCGGPPRITGGGMSYWTVSCKTCNSSGAMGCTKEQSADFWNRRVET